jgi:hypothetical protein
LKRVTIAAMLTNSHQYLFEQGGQDSSSCTKFAIRCSSSPRKRQNAHLVS